MPRKSTDQVIEHRITLGDLERGELRKVVKAEVFKDYGQLAQGFGVIGLGAGIGFASFVLMKWLAPDIPQLLADLPKQVFDEIVEVATPILDDTVDWAAKGNPVEHRRAAQALAERRAQLDRDITVFCSPSSNKYDAAICTKLNTQTKRQYFADLKAFNDMIDATYNPTSPTHGITLRNFIYKGLGDINPDNR